MKIISIETSGPVCAVALSDADKIIAEYSSSDGNSHDEYCAEYIRSVLNDFNLKIDNIDAIAISSGPGSFTGLRIGASIAKALCFKESDEDYAPKLISVPTLSAFANAVVDYYNFQKVNKIVAVIPAQKDVLYYQEFSISHPEPVEGEINLGSQLSVIGYRFTEGDIIISNIDDFKSLDFKDTIVCGPAAYIINPEPALPSLNEYSAEKIAKLAIKKYMLGEFTDPNDFKPIYVQDFVVKTKPKSIKISLY